MAIQFRQDQQLYLGKGPLDPKSLVKTYAELLTYTRWTDNGTDNGAFIAYNGMITAVWLNKADTTKNGVYLLFDPAVTSALKKPDVTKEENWHKFASLSDVEALASQLATLNEDIKILDEKVRNLDANKVIISRDNEYNYKTKTPLNNEVCLVDVPGVGLRVKIGDGETAFTDLTYLDDAVLNMVDDVVVKGYLYLDKFYKDAEHTILLEDIVGRIYIDGKTSKIYSYDGAKYASTSVPNASATVAGVVKLYDEMGKNTDGAMTQRAVTEELNQKFEVDFNRDLEMLIFDNDFES